MEILFNKEFVLNRGLLSLNKNGDLDHSCDDNVSNDANMTWHEVIVSLNLARNLISMYIMNKSKQLYTTMPG